MRAWTLRKSSASSLDVLSNCFSDDLLPVLLPIVDVRPGSRPPSTRKRRTDAAALQARLRESDWRLRESAILALGAVAEGCDSGLSHLGPQIIQGLLPMLDDPRPLVREPRLAALVRLRLLTPPSPQVRSISCWTLGRYSRLLKEGASRVPAHRQELLDALLAGLLKRVLDRWGAALAPPPALRAPESPRRNRVVQISACSALGALADEIQGGLVVRLEPIIQHLVFALGLVRALLPAGRLSLAHPRRHHRRQYQRKSLRYLYDAMGTVATAAGSALASPQLASALLPPLLAKWQTHAADDKEQLPLLDCLAQVIPSVGASFEPYAAPFYQRCVGMLQLQEQYKRGECAGREYDPDYVVRLTGGLCDESCISHTRLAQVCALDAVSALLDALRTSLDGIIATPPLRDWVFLVCADPNPCVRQSGFALMGDLAKCQPAHLMSSLQRCLEVCCAALQPDQLQPESMKASTNAGWSVGELVIRAPLEELQPVAVPLMQVLAPLLSMRTSTSKGLLENAAISLGRLALRCPQPLAPYLENFAEPWCVALRRVHDGQEKEQAFGGLCALVHQNPLAVWPFFLPLGNAFASWRNQNDAALHRSMAEILRGYKAHLPAPDWEAGWARLEPAVRDKLAAWFF